MVWRNHSHRGTVGCQSDVQWWWCFAIHLPMGEPYRTVKMTGMYPVSIFAVCQIEPLYVRYQFKPACLHGGMYVCDGKNWWRKAVPWVKEGTVDYTHYTSSMKGINGRISACVLKNTPASVCYRPGQRGNSGACRQYPKEQRDNLILVNGQSK